MASRVWERTEMRLLKLIRTLRELKPTGTELDRWKVGEGIYDAEMAMGDLIAARERAKKESA